jgi:hypothetical protein
MCVSLLSLIDVERVLAPIKGLMTNWSHHNSYRRHLELWFSASRPDMGVSIVCDRFRRSLILRLRSSRLRFMVRDGRGSLEAEAFRDSVLAGSWYELVGDVR